MKHLLQKLLTTVLILLLAVQPLAVAAVGGHTLEAPVGLLTNGVQNPQAVDADVPVFSWQIRSDARGTYQSAYAITVKEAISDTVIWTSGKVESDQSASVPYGGPALDADTAYVWRVQVWDQDGCESPCSDEGFFRVGLAKGQWTAQYIWDGTENTNDFAYFRKSFDIADKEIAEAVVYTSAHNDYQLYLNGSFVGVGPARSNPVTYGQYCTYDITEQLRSGSNTFAALAHWHGVWSDSGVNASPAYILEARIRYADGTEQTVATDASWKVQPDTAYIETSSVYFGHYGGVRNRASIRFDANRESIGWQNTEFADEGWASATVVNRPTYDLRAQLVSEETEMERETPVTVYQEGDKWFAEFDKCLTGWPELTITGNQAGDEVKLQYWEVQRGWGDAGYDTYICSGTNDRFYAPYVRHTSFKIIEITGLKGTLTKEQITGIVAYSEADNDGVFSTSDSKINDVFAMCERSGRQNIQQGIISVDANREQSPWTADSWNIGIGYLYNHRNSMVIHKVIHDYAGEQLADGNFLTCSPAIQYDSTMAEWSMYWPMLLWQEYLFRGDVSLLKETYGNLTAFLDYMAKYENISSGLYNPPGWRASDYAGGILESGGENIATNSQFYMNLRIAASVAARTDHEADSAVYAQKAEKLKSAINKQLLVDGECYRTRTDSDQTAALGTAWALRSGVVPAAFENRVIAWLANQKDDYNVGGYGGDALYSGLYEAGLGHIAAADYARYDQMLGSNNTNWESFGALSIDNMGNHAWTAYPSYLLPKYVGGVQPTSGGFADLTIRPVIGGLTSAEVSTPTVKGDVQVQWEVLGDDKLTMTVTIPANVRAAICVPDHDLDDLILQENGTDVYKNSAYVPGVDGITDAVREDGYIRLTAGSGTYRFTVTGTPLHTPLPDDVEVQTFVLDNDQAVLNGNWMVHTTDQAETRYGSIFAYTEKSATGAATATASYVFENMEPGNYRVYAWWTPHSNRATNAPYTVTAGDMTETVTVNQERNGGQWNLLGTYTLTEQGTVTVSLSNLANEYVIADAVKLERTPENPFTAKEKLLLYLYELETVELHQFGSDQHIAAFQRAYANAEKLVNDPVSTDERAAEAKAALERAYEELLLHRKTNLALRAPVTASTTMNAAGFWGTEYLTDGYIARDNNGRIGYTTDVFQNPVLATPITLTMDLGEEKTFNTITFVPRLASTAAGGKTANFMVDYQIKTSLDGKEFNTIHTVNDQSDPELKPLDVVVGLQNARYIQLEVTKLGDFASDEGESSGATPHRLQLTEIEVYRLPDNDDPSKKVDLILSGSESANAFDETVTYTLSGKYMRDLATMIVSFAVPDEYLTDPVAVAAEGWMILEQAEKDGVFHVSAANLEGADGEGEILTLTMKPTETPGQATVAITCAELAAYLEDGETFVEVNLEEAAVTTELKNNRFDVNKDGIVDQRDLTRAQRYFDTDHPDADVNTDGEVTVEDLILILNHFHDEFI